MLKGALNDFHIKNTNEFFMFSELKLNKAKIFFK
jgi:hypothetical protein